MPKNNFERYGVEADEFAEALAEGMREGGATEDEIREAVMGAHVDEAMPDDGGWTLHRA